MKTLHLTTEYQMCPQCDLTHNGRFFIPLPDDISAPLREALCPLCVTERSQPRNLHEEERKAVVLQATLLFALMGVSALTVAALLMRGL